MSFDKIKNIKPKKLDITNGDDEYAKYIGALPKRRSAGNIFAIIGTVAAAVLIVVGVSLWAIIGSGVRGTPPEDSVTIPAADTDGEDYIIKIKTAATLYASADGEVCGITPTNQKEARELANIIKNAEYKKTDCDCYGDCHVFFGDTTKAQYMIITNRILTAVHIKSQEGECQFNKAQSARIIELLKMVVTKQNRCFTVTSDIGKQYRSFIKKPYTVEERLGNPVTVMYGDDYVSTFSFDNADAKALRNMLESFEYDKPKCECFPSFSVAYDYLQGEYDDTGFDYKYSIIFERDSKNVHVCDRSGRHTLTKAEQNKLLGILFRQMAADNPSSSYMLDIVLPEYTDPVDVTCNGKTVALPDADIQSVTAYFLTFATYSADFCKCDKTYATFKIKGSEYSFCTCDEPRLTAPCGSRRVDQSVIDALRNKTDELFKTESPSAKPQESQTNDTKPPVNTTTNPNDDNCIIKIKCGNTLYISNDEFACGIHSSRQEEAQELADIIKNATYTKTDCSCRGCYNVYFDASRAADYAIYTSEAVSTVHIKSKDGECQFNKHDSERIIYLLKQVLIGDNEGYQMTPQYVTEYQPMFDSFDNDYGNKENPVTVRYLPDIFSDSFFTFYGNDSVKLKNLLESFDYSAPTCRCAYNFGVRFEEVSLEGRESFTSEYLIVLERDAKKAHVKTDKGTHFLTDSELQLICDIFFINLNGSTGGPYSHMYVVPAIPKQPIEITIGDKTHIVPPNINLVQAFQFDNKYIEDFCDCAKTYATVKINDIVYSICTCENARITSPCGTKRINEAHVKSICELLDKYISENTEKGEA